MPSAELPVTDYDAVEVLGRHAAEHPERVAAARQWPKMFATVAGYLVDARRHRDGVTVRPEVAYAWHLLERAQGRIPVGAMADRVGVSAR